MRALHKEEYEFAKNDFCAGVDLHTNFSSCVNCLFDYVCYQVSYTYSKEVAGNPAIAPHLYKFHGILNGIDPDIWDPFNDKFIPVSYSSSFML